MWVPLQTDATTFESLVRLVSSEGCSAATKLSDLCISMSSAGFVVGWGAWTRDLLELVTTAKACAEKFAKGLGDEYNFEELRSAAKVCTCLNLVAPPHRASAPTYAGPRCRILINLSLRCRIFIRLSLIVS